VLVVLDATDALTENMHVTVQLQWLPKLMDMLPDKLVEAMVGPGLAKFNDLKRVSFQLSPASSRGLMSERKALH
jgi:hypothetical protein